MTQDERNLNLLSLFHYILGGLIIAFSCYFLVCLAPPLFRLHGEFDAQAVTSSDGRTTQFDDELESLSRLMVLLPVAVILIHWLLAACLIVTGRKLKRRASPTFCLVVAAVECAMTGPGTVLGVFTIVILMKDSVRQLFAANTPPVTTL
jgi:hypothetical protein